MSPFSKGIETAEVTLRWDPSPADAPPHDLDLIAATFGADAPQGPPVYLVHFDSRSPDGTITLTRDSETGQGFGNDEVLKLELDRLADSFTRVVVGVAIQQRHGRRVFREIAQPVVKISEGYTALAEEDLSAAAPDATAATVARFARDDSGNWRFQRGVRGFDTDPDQFTTAMGGD
ncbi:tellurium resistance protein TerD [Streptomyces zhaozhouensis]|uniref:Tellurium resistance protein TerD n=1 Tax=Streptomyces zhaozhouensis TaxID=1300267 RepID=A0A286E000_9ACTN|nr:TerD family protein [Streptomyces zhaozhouensis]SOD64184.1 tellurium resistance protein TerD [Streptomyces zhaozhouensis]